MANIIVGVFDEYANAQAAHDALLEAGIEQRHVRIVQRPGSRAHHDEDDHRAFWNNIRDYFGIDEDNIDEDEDDAQSLGGGVVTVVVQPDTRAKVLHIMQEHEPISADARRVGGAAVIDDLGDAQP